MSRLVVTILLGCTLASQSSAQSEQSLLNTTQLLTTVCRAYIRITDGNRPNADGRDLLDAGTCVGYFLGFAGHDSYSKANAGMMPLYCVPANLNAIQVVKE